MNALTTRDRWLAAALPALLTLLVGWLGFLRPSGRDLAGLRQRVENQGSLTTRQALVAAADAERRELEMRVVATRATATEGGDLFDRNAAMQHVSLLCAAHGLSLNASALESGGKLPLVLQEALPALLRHGASTSPQVWRFELTGSYPNVVRLLDDLRDAKPLIVPLSLSMETGKTERAPVKWTLSLWL